MRKRALIIAAGLALLGSSPIGAAERVDEVLLDELTGVVPNPKRDVAELEPLYLQMFDSLARRLSSKTEGDRTLSQAQLKMMAAHVGQAGNEAQAKAFFGAVGKQLEKKDYPPSGRYILIRGLGSVGTSECVPTLEPLLGAGDAIEADMARMALQQIPGDEANTALVNALKGSPADPKTVRGLIDSLAARGSESAVTVITPLLDSPTPEIAAAAATALGRIGGSAATKALGAARSRTADKKAQMVIELALLDIAYQRGIDGDRAGAAKIFQVLGQQTKNLPVQIASMYGLARSNPKAADAIVIEAVRSKDPRTRSAGISASTMVPNRKLSTGLAVMLQTESKQTQLQILNALAAKGDISVQEKILEFLAQVEGKDKELEVAAIRALGSVGSVSVIELLLKKAISDEVLVREAARVSLSELKGQEIAQTIEFHARQGDTSEVRAVAIGLFMRNRDRTGLTRMMDFAAEKDSRVSAAAMSVLRQQASDTEFRKLLDLMSAGKLQVLPVLTSICGRTKNPDLLTGEIITYLRSTENLRYQNFLLSCLPLLSSSRGLSVIVDHIEKEGKTYDPAVKALARWPHHSALPEMLKLLERRHEDRATVGEMVRGITRLVDESKDSLSMENRVRFVADAFEVSKNPRERMLLLGVMSQLPDQKIADIVESMLKDRYVANAAANAAAGLCESMLESKPDAAKGLATVLANGSFNSVIRGRGKAVLKQLEGTKGSEL
ncbi:MAG: HEAT repeat domain-containing protein [Verrucomicrobiales bacterium]